MNQKVYGMQSSLPTAMRKECEVHVCIFYLVTCLHIYIKYLNFHWTAENVYDLNKWEQTVYWTASETSIKFYYESSSQGVNNLIILCKFNFLPESNGSNSCDLLYKGGVTLVSLDAIIAGLDEGNWINRSMFKKPVDITLNSFGAR